MQSQIWTDKESEILEKLCVSSISWPELFKKAKSELPGRTKAAVKTRVLKKHREWVEHFDDGGGEMAGSNHGNGSASGENGFGFPPEELELKLRHLLNRLKKGVATVTEISEDPKIDVPKEDVWPLIDVLRSRGYNIVEENRQVIYRQKSIPGVIPSLPPLTKGGKTGGKIEVLIMSDLCFGLTTQQGDLVATCLKIGEQRGVFFNLIAGNLVAGKPAPDRESEYFLKTSDEQAQYFIDHFPEASFNTFFLNGQRELSLTRGKDGARIENIICPERDDLIFLGDEKTTIPIGRSGAKVAVVAAGGNQQAYTKSYTLQAVMENLWEATRYVFEHSEPLQAVIAGGLYSGILIPRQLPLGGERFSDFDGVAIPALHRITPSQTVRKKRGGSPVLGCLVIGANFGDKGIFQGFTYAFYDLTPYFKEADYLEDIVIDPSLSLEAQRVVSVLKQGPARRGQLSRAIRKNIPHVQKALQELKGKGYKIWFDEPRKAFVLDRPLKKSFKPLDLNNILKTKIRVAATADWHIGHKGERPELVKEVFRIAEERKVDAIVHCGNILEGSGSYQGQENDLLVVGADNQRRHLMEILPKSDIPMFVIGSPIREHERVFWAKAGHDVVGTFAEIAELRGYNIKYLGGPHGVFEFKGVGFDLQHPKGGLPYGQTYRPQRRIETLVSNMPLGAAKVTFMGHLHRAAFLLYKGMAAFMVPGLQDQTEYVTALDKLMELGMWIVEFNFDEFNNLTMVELEYIPFDSKIGKVDPKHKWS